MSNFTTLGCARSGHEILIIYASSEVNLGVLSKIKFEPIMGQDPAPLCRMTALIAAKKREKPCQISTSPITAGIPPRHPKKARPIWPNIWNGSQGLAKQLWNPPTHWETQRLSQPKVSPMAPLMQCQATPSCPPMTSTPPLPSRRPAPSWTQAAQCMWARSCKCPAKHQGCGVPRP